MLISVISVMLNLTPHSNFAQHDKSTCLPSKKRKEKRKKDSHKIISLVK